MSKQEARKTHIGIRDDLLDVAIAVRAHCNADLADERADHLFEVRMKHFVDQFNIFSDGMELPFKLTLRKVER